MSPSALRTVTLASLCLGGLSCSAPPYVASGPAVLAHQAIPTSDAFLPTLLPSDTTAAAADPSLPGFSGWPLRFDASTARGASLTCEVEVQRGATTLATLTGALEDGVCTAVWDGLESGLPARPGALVVEARLVRGDGLVRATAVLPLEVVRLGVQEIDVEVAAGGRSPLLFRRTGGRRGGYYELLASEAPFGIGADGTESGASALELASGARRPVPLPWNDIVSPPLDPRSADGVEHDSFNLPSAVLAGRSPTLLLALATEAAGGASGDPLDTEVRLVAPDGTRIAGQDRVSHGTVVTLEHLATPVPGVGRFDVTYTFTFEARRMGGTFQPIPGELPITLRYYGLVGAPSFASNAVPHRPWVDVVDRIAEWVGGSTADPERVAARLVEGVYYELGLRYDTASGASFYTDYLGPGFDGAAFEMDAFEERAYGSVVNCSDSASILSTYANMVGLDFRYHILRHRTERSFDLNFIRAIGGAAFDDTPFDGGRGEFSYHAIVGARDGTTWDATLAVDGDGAPASAPHALLLVQGMGAMDYLDALSSEATSVVTTFDDHVRIR